MPPLFAPSQHTQFYIMTISNLKSLVFGLSATILLILAQACGTQKNEEDNTPKFTIKGTLSNADGKVLYFANTSLGGTIILDSVKLDSDGAFEFQERRPETFEFFIVGFHNDTPAVIAIDSTETVTITADAANLAKSYTVEGSPASMDIKEMSELVKALEEQINAMAPDATYLAKKAALINEFKENIAKQYIVPAPDKSTAYFALWLTCKNENIFKPLTNRNDSKYYAGVATSMQRLFPKAARTEHIATLAERGLKETRPLTGDRLEAFLEKTTTENIFEVNLPNREGDSIKLSSLKGKVVLLDFTVFGNSKIKMRNIDFRELYDKYNKRGFEIYQVSYDEREHFWQQEALALPWICVRDDRGGASPYFPTFNLQTIPTYFLLNRENDVVLRDQQITDLDKEIEKLLKE